MTYPYQDEGKRSFVSVDGRFTTMQALQEEQRLRERAQNPEEVAGEELMEQARRAYIVGRSRIEEEAVLKALSGQPTPISVVPAPPGIEWVGLDGDDLHEVRQPVEFVLYVQDFPDHFDTKHTLHLRPFYSLYWGRWGSRAASDLLPTSFFGEGSHLNKERTGACSCEEKTCALVGLAFPGKPFSEEKLEKRREWLRKLEAKSEKARGRYQRSKQKKAAEEVL